MNWESPVSLKEDLDSSWKTILNSVQDKLDSIEKCLDKEIETFKDDFKIFPDRSLVFNALKQCKFDDVKVVIIGQDPYHGLDKRTNEPQAMGLSFSVPKGAVVPPSLANMYKELEADPGVQFKKPGHGDLTSWANQGVLLLNAGLTVRESKANSHVKFNWFSVTDEIVKQVAKQKENVVFILMGAFAQKKLALMTDYVSKHHFIVVTHPSPLSAHRGFFGSKIFSKCNTYLKENGQKEINWQN